MALYTQEKRQQLQHKLCKPGDNSDIFKALKGKKKKKKVNRKIKTHGIYLSKN